MADEPAPSAPSAQPAPAPHEDEGPPQGSWNPLKTPVATAIFLLQLGVAIAAIQGTTSAGGSYMDLSVWLQNNGFTFGYSNIHQHPLRLFTSLVAEPLAIQVAMNLMIWWSAGPALERVFKAPRLLFLYVVAGLCCFFLCDFLNHAFPTIFTTNQGRSAARHAVISCSGSVLGLLIAIEGLVAALKSRLFWSQVFSLGLAYVLTLGLSRGGAPVGLDITGMLVDMVGGSVLGFALGLTLFRGPRKIMGFLLCALFLFGTGGEIVAAAVRSVLSDPNGFTGRKSNDGSKDSGSPKNDGPNQRLPEEAATPRPTLPDDEDPPPIARRRKDANEFLASYGALPQPSGDPEDQGGARRKRDDLKDFDNHWTGHASANLEAEMAELAVIAGDLKAAEDQADQALTLMEGGLTPTKAQGSVRAKRIARLHGVLGTCYAKRGDEVGARNQFRLALEWDPQLTDVHFFLGKLEPVNKDELQAYIKAVGPNAPQWQQERALEARRLLGN